MTLEQTTTRDDEPVHPLLRPRSDVAERMVAATIDVIDRHGEVAVRVQDIVDSVGVQAPILYRNFANREGLVQAAQATRLQRDMDSEVGRFQVAIEAAESVEEFADLIDAMVDAMSGVERRALRWQRINVIGSAYGRPDLTDAVAQLMGVTIARITESFRPAQTRGWIRADLDLEVFASWFAGQTLGRILIEFGDSDTGGDQWNAISASAIRHVLIG